MIEIIDGLATYCRRKGLAGISDIIGAVNDGGERAIELIAQSM